MVSSSLGALLWHLHWAVPLIKHNSSVATAFLKGLFLQDDSWSNTAVCEYHSPEQSPHSRGREALFGWNKAQITQASPCEQAGICVYPEQGSIQVTHYPRKEVRRFWVTFSPIGLSAVSGAAVDPAQPRASHGPASSAAECKQAEEAWALPASRERRQYCLVIAPSSPWAQPFKRWGVSLGYLQPSTL